MMIEQTDKSKHKTSTGCIVTFSSGATVAAYVNPPVSSRPDPVWKERMWDVHIPSYRAGNVLSKWTHVLLLKEGSPLDQFQALSHVNAHEPAHLHLKASQRFVDKPI